MLDVSVKLEIIDFLQPRIKQKLLENIIITPEKCVIVIMFNLDPPAHENDSWSMFWPWPIFPGHGDQDHDQRIILELDFSRGGGRGLRETSQGRFSGQNR